MENNNFPTLLSATSLVIRCGSCHTWVERVPTFLGFEGEWHCEKCGCTSTVQTVGRPFGPKYAQWDWIEMMFHEIWKSVIDDSQEAREYMLEGCKWREGNKS